MEYKKLVEYWRKSAEHDYETMLGLYRIRRYSDCLFFGHMVLEKMFKALVVRNTEKDAPYVHNLVSLAKLSGLTLDKIDLALIGQINEFNIRARYPEYKLDSDLGAFAKSVAKSQLERNINFSLLPTAIKEKTLGDLSGQVMANLSKFLGFSLDAENTFGDAVLAFANKSLTDLKGKFGPTFVTVWAIAVFVFIRGLATLFGYLVSFVSFLVYHALIAFGVIRVKTENKPHEIVEFF